MRPLAPHGQQNDQHQYQNDKRADGNSFNLSIASVARLRCRRRLLLEPCILRTFDESNNKRGLFVTPREAKA